MLRDFMPALSERRPARDGLEAPSRPDDHHLHDIGLTRHQIRRLSPECRTRDDRP